MSTYQTLAPKHKLREPSPGRLRRVVEEAGLLPDDLPAGERGRLLMAIAASPEEDTPRLEYADWLDESGSGDVDAATVEFLRISCDMRVGRKPTAAIVPAAALWLRLNWRRLVPSLDGLHVPHGFERSQGPPPTYPGGVFRGRTCFFFMRLPYARGRVRTRFDHAWYRIELGFRRGFADFVSIRSNHAAGLVLPALRADQPLIKLYPVRRGAVRIADVREGIA